MFANFSKPTMTTPLRFIDAKGSLVKEMQVGTEETSLIAMSINFTMFGKAGSLTNTNISLLFVEMFQDSPNFKNEKQL